MIALLFALLLAAAGPSTPSSDIADFVSQPIWLKLPNGDDMARYRPGDSRVSGRAVIECKVSGRGLLEFCQVLEETPGQQYGKAALAIAARFRMGPMDRAGQATAGRRVRIPLTWTLTPRADAVAGSLIQAPPVIDGVPRLLAHPSGQNFVDVYPRRALRDRMGGRAVIACGLLVDGSLRDCAVVEEAPLGMGFGSAALRLAPFFRVAPTDGDGKSTVDAPVRIPLVWKPPPSPE